MLAVSSSSGPTLTSGRGGVTTDLSLTTFAG